MRWSATGLCMPNRSHSLSGYLLARNARFWQLAVQLRWLTLVAAALAIATELVIRYLGMHVQLAQLPQVLAALPWETLEHGARAAYTWLALLTLLGWAKQRLNHPFRWLPYCTEAVFPVHPASEPDHRDAVLADAVAVECLAGTGTGDCRHSDRLSGTA